MHAHSPASIRLMMALTPKRLFLSLSLCISISLLRPYTFSHAHLWSLKLSLKMRVSSNELFSTLKMKALLPLPAAVRYRLPIAGGSIGSFAKTCHGKSFYSRVLFVLEQQGAHEYYSVKKIRSVPHFLQSPAIDKEPESNAKMCENQMEWQDCANLKAHILSRSYIRAKFRYVGVFSNAVFNHFPLEDFSQTKGNRFFGTPRTHFSRKLKIDY